MKPVADYTVVLALKLFAVGAAGAFFLWYFTTNPSTPDVLGFVSPVVASVYSLHLLLRTVDRIVEDKLQAADAHD